MRDKEIEDRYDIPFCADLIRNKLQHDKERERERERVREREIVREEDPWMRYKGKEDRFTILL